MGIGETKEGLLKHTGGIKRKRDNLHLMDCTVTGSSNETAKGLKSSLQRMFQLYIFPIIQELIGPGGNDEGYQPIGSGDGAGPHVKQKFLNLFQELYAREGCAWEPQAEQIPHINVLNLAIFP